LCLNKNKLQIKDITNIDIALFFCKAIFRPNRSENTANFRFSVELQVIAVLLRCVFSQAVGSSSDNDFAKS
jgi:hypothetical protein